MFLWRRWICFSFFFSSRRRHTRSKRDWSSDVCSSDLEIIEMIQVWAALESMSARLATLHAPDAEIGKLRHLFDSFQNSPPSDHIDEYSDANIAFHQMIIRLGGSRLIEEATKNLFLHVRAIRRATISQNNRAARSRSRKSLKAAATGGRCLVRLCTRYQFSRAGKSCTSSTTRLPASRSRPMVWAERNAIPIPATTACLMVSVLAICIAMLSFPNCRPNTSRIEFQVSDPGSRITKRSRLSAVRGICRAPASG